MTCNQVTKHLDVILKATGLSSPTALLHQINPSRVSSEWREFYKSQGLFSSRSSSTTLPDGNVTVSGRENLPNNSEVYAFYKDKMYRFDIIMDEPILCDITNLSGMPLYGGDDVLIEQPDSEEISEIVLDEVKRTRGRE